jgi:hypothetical protein
MERQCVRASERASERGAPSHRHTVHDGFVPATQPCAHASAQPTGAARAGADDMRFRHSELRERANAYFEEIRDEARGSVR